MKVQPMLSLSPLRKGCDDSFKQTWILVTQVLFCAQFVWNLTCDYGIKILKFHDFVPRGSSIEKNCFPIQPRMLCATIGWNWRCGSVEEDLNFAVFLSFFRYHIPFKKGVALSLNKLVFLSPKDALFGWNWQTGDRLPEKLGKVQLRWASYKSNFLKCL